MSRAWSRPARPGLPIDGVVLVVIAVAEGLFSLYDVLLPMSRHSPVRLDLVAGIVALALAVLDASRYARLPRWFVHAQLLAFIAYPAVIVAVAATRPGQAEAGAGILIVTLYAALFLPTSYVFGYGSAAIAAGAAAVLSSDLHTDLREYLPVYGAGLVLIVVIGRLLQHFRRSGETDQLTGLLNRRGLDRVVLAELQRSRLPARLSTLALIDLDGLKAVNDQHGHLAGDHLIEGFARELLKALHGRDAVVGRYGGDEFVVLLRGTDLDQAEAALARLRATSTASCSVGFATLQAADGFDTWFARADADLYRQKRARQRQGTGSSPPPARLLAATPGDPPPVVPASGRPRRSPVGRRPFPAAPEPGDNQPA